MIPTTTTSPSHEPTFSPTSSPTSAPSIEKQECTLVARLGHPYNDPDDAPYKGYHYDWLEVSRYEDDDDSGSYCDAWTTEQWCEYENSVKGETGAYWANVDDYYYPEWAEETDALHKEKITTVDMIGTSYFSVYHYFFEQDYYTSEASWADHMMAAKLTIWNKTRNIGLHPQGGWSHPVDINTPTHINGEINPDYSGYFYIEVNCSSTCECTVSAPIPFEYEQETYL